MGRYYNGDIEGKFWFGVQSSSDADFFGKEGEPTHINYYYSEEDLTSIEKGLKTCKETLGKHFKDIEKFFSDLDKKKEIGYNNEMIEKSLKVSSKRVAFILEWYARWKLGEQIRKCVKEHQECNFEAEL
jgi:hypothetical protein